MHQNTFIGQAMILRTRANHIPQLDMFGEDGKELEGKWRQKERWHEGQKWEESVYRSACCAAKF